VPTSRPRRVGTRAMLTSYWMRIFDQLAECFEPKRYAPAAEKLNGIGRSSSWVCGSRENEVMSVRRINASIRLS